MEVGSARCADRTQHRGILTRIGRASGYCALYSGLEDRRVSLNTYARWNPVLESHQPLRFCKPPPALLGQRDELRNQLALASRSAVVNKPRDDVLKAALRSIRSLSRVEHAQFSQLAARKLTFGDAVSVASINLTRFGTVDRYLLGEVEAPRTVTLHETFRE